MKDTYIELMGIIEQWENKDIEVIQSGFMEARYVLSNIRYDINEDILTIYSKNNNKLSFNINMINGTKPKKDSIEIYLDNDSIIKLTASFN